MKYGVYLTINGGEDMILVGEYRYRRDAKKALDELSRDDKIIPLQAKGRDVTCLEVLNNWNLTTMDYVPYY